MNRKFVVRNLFSARNIFIIIIIIHCINNFLWFRKDGYVVNGTHTVWIEEQAFKYVDAVFYGEKSFSEKVFATIDFFRLNQIGENLSVTNFNLTAFLISFPIAAQLDGYVKLFLINVILYLQFLLVLFGVYYLGKAAFNQETGFWAAIILSFYPGIIGLSRRTNCELPATFFIIISLVIFLRWRSIPGYLRPVLLFIVLGLGILSGAIYLAFFIPLFLLHIYFEVSFNKRNSGNFIWLAVFLLLMVVFFAFYLNGNATSFFLNIMHGAEDSYKNLFLRSGNWYGSASQGLREVFLFASQDANCPCTQTTNVGLNLKTFLFYILAMINYTSVFFFFLAICSFFPLPGNKEVNFYKKMVFVVWIVLGYLFLSLFYIKWGKFITPILPALALSSSVFVCGFKKSKYVLACKIAILCVGITTAIYYSFFALPVENPLENLEEHLVCERPRKSKFVEVSEKLASVIDASQINGSDIINIAFLDKDSSRFAAKTWVTDQSLRIKHLVRLFLRKKHRLEFFWGLCDDFYGILDKQNFIILITHKKLNGIKDYLYPEEFKNKPGKKFETVYEGKLREDTFIYLARILK